MLSPGQFGHCAYRNSGYLPGDPWESIMSEDLKKLIEVAKRVTPTPEQQEEQRRSFAYGNTAFENDRITREMVDQQAEKLADDAKRTK
jgi:hypothetical protein